MKATQQALSDWLEALDLGQYTATFIDNEVDLEAMRLLDDGDLRELGLPLGPRKIVLKAIGELNAVAAAARTAPFTAWAAAAQRRQITVLFCDLVGSTALSRALDPEDLRELMRRYQGAAKRVVERYDGHIAQYLGDGVMVYFGWPRGHGDDARRALRAALELVADVSRLDADPPLAVRIGIATGLVVVGQTADGDASQQSTAVGETPNLAARLQALAEPNQIVVAALTRRLGGNSFVFDDLGDLVLRGIAEPVRAFAVSGASATPDEAEAPARPLPLLVGRDEEIGRLRRAWQQARDGHGQAVLLSGEPGIGKSALVAALLAQLREQGVPRAAVHCSALHTHSAMFPLVELVHRVVGWVDGDGADANLARLVQRLEQDGMPADESVPTLAALLELPLPEGCYAPLDTTPQMLKRRIFEDLAEWQIAMAGGSPMVVVWEDVHWADPSSLEYAALLIERLPAAPLLFVLTTRPGLTVPWTLKSHVVPILLNRLEPAQIVALVGRVAGGKALPEAVLEHIVRKTDGVPLFVEELTRTILTSNVVRESGDCFELSGPLSSLSIPATLHESLMARLDRAPGVREVAQLGAVLGREFDYDLLRSLGLIDHALLDEGLSLLVADELLYQRGRVPRASYAFKHALIQDAAYQSLLKRTRRHYHRRVALCLEQRSPRLAEPELLAHHYAAAGLPLEAGEYWLKASRHAAERSAYAESLAQVDAAMALLEAQPECSARTLLRARLQLQRATALQATQGMGTAATGAAFMQARALCAGLEADAQEIFQVLYGLYAYHSSRAELDAALAFAQEALARARQLDDPSRLMLGHRIVGTVLHHRGEQREAALHLEQGVRLYDPQRDRDCALLYGSDLKATGLGFLAWTQALLGFPERALATAEAARRHAAALNFPYTTAFTERLVLIAHGLLLEHARVIELATELMARCEKYGLRMWHLYARQSLGAHLVAVGRVEEGAALLEQVLREQDESGTRSPRSVSIEGLAFAAARSKQWPRATALYEQALREVDAIGSDRYEAELRRRHGEFFLARDGPRAGAASAEACFVASLDIARRQGARLYELRTAVSLARLWHSQGKTREARELLAPIYAWFTEGFATVDLKAARALLDELEGSA